MRFVLQHPRDARTEAVYGFARHIRECEELVCMLAGAHLSAAEWDEHLIAQRAVRELRAGVAEAGPWAEDGELGLAGGAIVRSRAPAWPTASPRAPARLRRLSGDPMASPPPRPRVRSSWQPTV